jgi:hypothetical protein
MQRLRMICQKGETVGVNGFMQKLRKVCQKGETVGGNGFMQRLRKICEKRNCWGIWVHAWIYFFGFHVLIYKSSKSCNLCSAQEKRTQNKPIFFLKSGFGM